MSLYQVAVMSFICVVSLATADSTVRDCSDPNNIYLPPTATNTSIRLAALRVEMMANGYDAYIVPTEDEHLSEYIADRDRRRVWITGFTGSAGIAVVTMTEAALWTDGRYFLQAEQQLDCNWELMRTEEPGVPTVDEWVLQKLESQVAAANPYVFSIDLIWTDRPPRMGTEIKIYPIEYAGKDWTTKISELRETMQDAGADYLLVSSMEEVAWLFNLRGNDLSTIPIFDSYAIIGRADFIRLYANTTQLDTPELDIYFNPTDCEMKKICIETYETDQPRNHLLSLSASSKVWMSAEGTTYGMYSAVPEERQIQDISPIKVPKAIKNPVEIEGMKKAHIWDAIALCEYLWWLEENVPNGEVDEISGAAKLKSLRLAQPKSKGLSFGSISAVGANAAVIHYGTSEETNRKLTLSEIYLVDSGGQYLEGSTDVTRTVHFGTPSAFEKEAYTRVLMGMINIETAIFPATLDGNDIDILARQHLYDAGLDFRHGTGHGIGHYMSIHEYPPAIGRAQAEGYPFQPGMFTSNEPGYYEEGEFGIRLENIVMVEKTDTTHHFGEYDFLTLTSVTLVPFQKKMIDVTMLSDKQLEYLNGYHARVLAEIGNEAKAQNKDGLYDWLAKVTTPIARSGSAMPEVSIMCILSALISVKMLQ